jgi:hypothetical protein
MVVGVLVSLRLKSSLFWILNVNAISMNSRKPAKANTRNADQGASSLLAGDTLVYLVLIGLTWLTWRVSRQSYFEAGDDIGYWLGVAGGSMMLLLFSYQLSR